MSAPVNNQVKKALIHKTRWSAEMIRDPGNFPLILANGLAASMIFIVGTRKLLYHPDVGLSSANRSKEMESETPMRYENGVQFRDQTKSWADMVRPWSARLMKISTGSDQLYDKWSLSYIASAPSNARPLEHTNFFEDDLYDMDAPDNYVLSQDNSTLYKNYEEGY